MQSRTILKILLSGICYLFICKNVQAQIIPIGSSFDATARSMQLMGKVDSSFSFLMGPLMGYAGRDNTKGIYSMEGDTMSYRKPLVFAAGKGSFIVLPLTLTQQYNSHHPYGWNDGAMIPAKGYQVLASAGIYASIGPLAIQLQPEFVFAANTGYEHSSLYGSQPTGSYSKLFAGQSFISVSSGALSIGYGTQNLWWGPGIRSSLLMSNNAPGFGHFFFKTRKPLHTGIGSFEWQLIGGQLNSDDQTVYENKHLLSNTRISKSRYLNGIIISYQPKWTPGLFVGFTRSVQSYTEYNRTANIGFLEKYIPVIALSIQKKNNLGDDSLRRDQLASFFLRWLLPKANTEFYIEYGFNDYGLNTRDYLLGPSHSAAYIAGFKKIMSLRNMQHLELGLELTQMSQTPDWIVRDAGNWYEHGQIGEGYTNQNQILGAGAGFGANVQSITATWIKGWKQLGILIERIDRDPQRHTTKWIDFGVGILPQWRHNQFLFSGKFEFVNSKCYMWEFGVNRLNFHSRLSVSYLL